MHRQRDVYRVPARLVNRGQQGWFMLVTLGSVEYAFHYGPDKPALTTPMISLILEYAVEDNAVT